MRGWRPARPTWNLERNLEGPREGRADTTIESSSAHNQSSARLLSTPTNLQTRPDHPPTPHMTIVSQKGASKPSVRTPQLVRVETSPDWKADNALPLSWGHSTAQQRWQEPHQQREGGGCVADYHRVSGKQPTRSTTISPPGHTSKTDSTWRSPSRGARAHWL